MLNRGAGQGLDQGMNIEGLVQHTFHLYDQMVGNSFDVRDGVDMAGDNLGMDGNGEQRHNRGARADMADGDAGLRDGIDDRGDGIPYCDADEDDMGDDDLPAMEGARPTQRQVLEESAKTPLFAGSGLTQLGGTLLLLNCLRTHGASNTLVNEVFSILSKSMLPTVNSLPRNEYQASKVLNKLGLAYETIHCCPGPNTCVLFRGEELKDLTACPKCGTQRYKQVGKSSVPAKVLRWFPLIPRLQRMYSTPLQASFLTWHARHVSEDGIMRGAVDSYQWKFVDWKYPEFANEPRNLRLGLATDGVNPFSIKRSTWSTWPVLILNYNLPPWMTTKKHFIMLSLIIPGKKSVTGENFDVYLQPLVEELQILWGTGVQTEDASMYNGSRRFNMKAILLWTMHDFPAYGIVAGCVTKGYKGCPICGSNTISRRSLSLRKNVYDDQHRCFLPVDHPWRAARPEFNNAVENRGPPPKRTAADVIRWGRLRESWVQLRVGPASSDPARESGIKRLSSLYDLPYWQVCSRHYPSSVASMVIFMLVILSSLSEFNFVGVHIDFQELSLLDIMTSLSSFSDSAVGI